MAAAKGNDYTLLRKVRPQHTQEELEEIAKDLLHYAETAKSIHLAPWSRKRNKSLSWIIELAKDHEIINTAYIQAKELLAAKVLNSSFYGEGNATVGMAYLPVYDLEYRAWLELKARLDKDNSSQSLSLSSLKELKDKGLLDKLLSQPNNEDKS